MKDLAISPAGRARRWAARSMLATLLLALSAGAAMAGNGSVAVRGTQLAYGTCGENSDGYRMTGDLDGCWWITDFVSSTDESKHNVRATGAELFIGWVGSRFGSFTTRFQYTAKMDGPWVSSPEIHGRCHHPIVAGSGTGDLAGISGELSFKDVVDVDPPYYPYWGNLRIAGQALTLDSAASAARKANTTTTTAISC